MNGTMTRNQTLRLTMTGMFMAMTVILSLSIFSIPVPGGHLYFCDTVINVAAILLDPVSAFVLDPLYALLVGGVGAFIGDMLFYPPPMFVSLVTHGLQAVVVSLISHRILKRRQALASGIGVIVGAIIMVIGYTLGRAYVYSTLEYSLIKLPFEIVQAGFGAVFSMVICYPLRLRELYFKVVN